MEIYLKLAYKCTLQTYISVESLFEKKYMTKCDLFRLYLCKGAFGTIHRKISRITSIGKW